MNNIAILSTVPVTGDNPTELVGKHSKQKVTNDGVKNNNNNAENASNVDLSSTDKPKAAVFIPQLISADGSPSDTVVIPPLSNKISNNQDYLLNSCDDGMVNQMIMVLMYLQQHLLPQLFATLEKEADARATLMATATQQLAEMSKMSLDLAVTARNEAQNAANLSMAASVAGVAGQATQVAGEFIAAKSSFHPEVNQFNKQMSDNDEACDTIKQRFTDATSECGTPTDVSKKLGIDPNQVTGVASSDDMKLIVDTGKTAVTNVKDAFKVTRDDLADPTNFTLRNPFKSSLNKVGTATNTAVNSLSKGNIGKLEGMTKATKTSTTLDATNVKFFDVTGNVLPHDQVPLVHDGRLSLFHSNVDGSIDFLDLESGVVRSLSADGKTFTNLYNISETSLKPWSSIKSAAKDMITKPAFILQNQSAISKFIAADPDGQSMQFKDYNGNVVADNKLYVSKNYKLFMAQTESARNEVYQTVALAEAESKQFTNLKSEVSGGGFGGPVGFKKELEPFIQQRNNRLHQSGEYYKAIGGGLRAAGMLAQSFVDQQANLKRANSEFINSKARVWNTMADVLSQGGFKMSDSLGSITQEQLTAVLHALDSMYQTAQQATSTH